MRTIAKLILIVTTISAQTTTTYSWEDGGTILGSYGNVSNPLNVGTTGTVDPYDDSAMLSVSESPLSGTPQVYIAFIENLSEGDEVTASFYGYDNTPSASPSLRIWGHYASNGDINDHKGSAGGNTEYTDGTGWSQLSNTWTIPVGKEALVIEARLYSGTVDDPMVYFIDLVSVTAPVAATVTYPAPPTLSANAGADQTVSVNTTVTLDGSLSEGTIASWAWTRLTGTTVTINNSDQAVANFTAPSTESILTFQLTVTNDLEATDLDTVVITVVDVGASLVFISEYVEGSFGNNKYLEIYNGSDAAVDLAAEGYTLARDNNGDTDFTYAVLNNWGTLNLLPADEVIVLASETHTLYTSPDTVLVYNSPVHFNGNDAVALLKNGVIVDMVGELGNSVDHIKDMTLRRQNSVTQGNSVFTWSEWVQTGTDDVSGLGFHGGNMPTFENVLYSPDFFLENTAINIQVDITPADGGTAIVSSVIAYGANYLNTLDMFAIGVTWYGQIPASATMANSNFNYIFRVTDDDGNVFESSAQNILIGSSTPITITSIHTDIGNLVGTIQTVHGNVTIGSGLLATSWTSLYIQDASNRGLNLYKSGTDVTLMLGDKVTVVGEVDLFSTTVEIKDFVWTIIAGETYVPDPLSITIADAITQSQDYEGTLIQLIGEVSANDIYSNAVTITITDGGGNDADIRIWNSTGIDASQYVVGQTHTFIGVGSQYDGTFQLLIGYDASTYLAIDSGSSPQPQQFSLAPAYPNPFNPITHLTWQVEQAGKYQIAIYNLLGQKIDVIHSSRVDAGRYITEWDAGQISSGIYFVRLSGEGLHAIQKVMLLK